jgi:hypothetical protein
MVMDKAPNVFSRAIDEQVIARLRLGDVVELAVVGERPRFSGVFSAEPDVLRSANRRLFELTASERYGPSPVWDALDDAIHRLAERPEPRAVVFVSDGKGSGNVLGWDDVIRHALTSGVAVFVVAEGADARILATWNRDTPPPANAATMLRTVAAATGGLVVTDGLEDRWQRPRPAALLQAIVTALQSRLQIRFTAPAATTGRQPLEIRSVDASRRVHHAAEF